MKGIWSGPFDGFWRAAGAVCVAAVVLAGCDDDDDGTGPSGPPGRTVYGVDASNNLVSFGALRPDQVTQRTAITGLATGETVVGIDFRPADGQLYAVGSSSRIYTINVQTAVAAAIPAGAVPFTPALAGASFGVDFNPVPDRIRVHSDAEQDLRLNQLTGTVAAVDGVLAYVAGDVNAGANPAVVGTAYTNSVAGAMTTVLFAIDAERDALVTLPNPNDGQMTTVGALGVGIDAAVGFDIAGNDGTAYAALTAGSSGGSRFYTVNLTTGTAALVGTLGGGARLVGIAVAP